MSSELSRFTTSISTLVAGQQGGTPRPSSDVSMAFAQAAGHLYSDRTYGAAPWGLPNLGDWPLPFAQFAQALERPLGFTPIHIDTPMRPESDLAQAWLGSWSRFSNEWPRFLGKAVNDLAHALAPQPEGFTHSQIRETFRLESLSTVRDWESAVSLSPSITWLPPRGEILPQPPSLYSSAVQKIMDTTGTAATHPSLFLEMPELPRSPSSFPEFTVATVASPPTPQTPDIRVLMGSDPKPSSPAAAPNPPAPSPINVQGGIHVHITAERIDRAHATETSRQIANQVLKELDRIAQQNRFRRGLPASPSMQ